MAELNPRQRRFVDNIHAGNMSLVQAYLDAGYKDSTGKYSAASTLLRNDKIIAELDKRLFNKDRLAEQRFGNMLDGSTNVYVRILTIDPKDDSRLLELQRKVAADVFDRRGLKPPEKVEHSGEIQVSLLDILRAGRKRLEEGQEGE